MKRHSIAVYPGTFDPITYGHIDLIIRGLNLFDKLIIAIAEDSPKKVLFTIEERKYLIKESLNDYSNKIEICSFKGTVVNFLLKNNIKFILRGLRTLSDFEYEFQMALTNRKLSKERIETVFIMTSEKYSTTSSRLIKEIAALGGDVSCFVPKVVEEKLKDKFLKG